MQAVVARAMPGIVGGLIGGVAFGILMQAMDMLPMVAQLVGSESIAVGWAVHLVISAGIGLGYAEIIGPKVSGPAAGLVTGAIWGVVWWVLGALLLMPLFLGMNDMVFALNTTAWQSLMGHVIYGVILGAFFGIMAPKMLKQAAERH